LLGFFTAGFFTAGLFHSGSIKPDTQAHYQSPGKLGYDFSDQDTDVPNEPPRKKSTRDATPEEAK
jgi:hypothetical protein